MHIQLPFHCPVLIKFIVKEHYNSTNKILLSGETVLHIFLLLLLLLLLTTDSHHPYQMIPHRNGLLFHLLLHEALHFI
jgi:hypothetical protein